MWRVPVRLDHAAAPPPSAPQHSRRTRGNTSTTSAACRCAGVVTAEKGGCACLQHACGADVVRNRGRVAHQRAHRRQQVHLREKGKELASARQPTGKLVLRINKLDLDSGALERAQHLHEQLHQRAVRGTGKCMAA